jgi:hypothetical protein
MGMASYDGVESRHLDGRLLSIVLTTAAAADLEVESHLRMALPEGGAVIADLALRRLVV